MSSVAAWPSLGRLFDEPDYLVSTVTVTATSPNSNTPQIMAFAITSLASGLGYRLTTRI
jgi:hypothetical protein